MYDYMCVGMGETAHVCMDKSMGEWLRVWVEKWM